MARWRSGLTHMPLMHAFMGSKPVRVTNEKLTAQFAVFLLTEKCCQEK